MIKMNKCKIIASETGIKDLGGEVVMEGGAILGCKVGVESGSGDVVMENVGIIDCETGVASTIDATVVTGEVRVSQESKTPNDASVSDKQGVAVKVAEVSGAFLGQAAKAFYNP